MPEIDFNPARRSTAYATSARARAVTEKQLADLDLLAEAGAGGAKDCTSSTRSYLLFASVSWAFGSADDFEREMPILPSRARRNRLSSDPLPPSA